MFSTAQKQYIAGRIEEILLELGHPEMPLDRPAFKLHVDGKESWSWADIEPNWKFGVSNPPSVNPWNEVQENYYENRNNTQPTS